MEFAGFRHAAKNLLPVTSGAVVIHPEGHFAVVADAAAIALHHALHGDVSHAFFLHGECVEVVAVIAGLSHPGMERAVKDHVAKGRAGKLQLPVL